MVVRNEEADEESTSTATVDAIAVYLGSRSEGEGNESKRQVASAATESTVTVCPVNAAHVHRLGALWMCPHGLRHSECNACVTSDAMAATTKACPPSSSGEQPLAIKVNSSARLAHKRQVTRSYSRTIPMLRVLMSLVREGSGRVVVASVWWRGQSNLNCPARRVIMAMRTSSTHAENARGERRGGGVRAAGRNMSANYRGWD